MTNYLHLPCLRGVIGNWTYFCSVMKIKDIVGRIITVSESKELYATNINEILQREINSKRVDQIKDYINNNPEHFFSSIIVAIYQGNPIWSDFDIESHFRIENNCLDTKEIEFIENKLGILSLSGEEVIFALDGQHRIKGIREAYKNNPVIGDEEISLTFVVHNQNERQRTRRLFTVLNKYAQKPKEAELIILDEDDCAAIITRRLLEYHPVLSLANAISNSNIASIPTNDFISFSTLVMINRINKELLRKNRIDYTKRPPEEELYNYYIECKDFWDFFFIQFPQIKNIIESNQIFYFNNGDLYNRNNQTGGCLLLRPIGQFIFAQIYNVFKEQNQLDVLSEKVRLIDFNLNGYLCKYITWHNKIIGKSVSLQRNIFYYILGINKNESIHQDISKVYESFGALYKEKIHKL